MGFAGQVLMLEKAALKQNLPLSIVGAITFGRARLRMVWVETSHGKRSEVRIYDTAAICAWVPDQIRDGFGCDRLAEIVALDFIAIVVAQEGKLFCGFNALGDDAEIELLPKGNHGGRHGPVAFTAGEIVDERLVNFQSGHREGFQRVETGITRAEIVNGELNTEALAIPPWFPRPDRHPA